jgi:hypothetical protein
MTSGKAMAQYAITNSFSVSATNQYVAPDQFSATAGTNINYSSIAIANIATNTSLPNGNFGPLAGTLAGKASPGFITSVTTAFTFDAVNGLELIGDYTENSAGSHTAAVQGLNQAGQVIGYEGRDDPNSASTGSTSSVLGEETWLSTPTGPGKASSQFLGLFGPNNTYTASTSTLTTGTYSIQQPQYISSTGYVIGNSARYEGDTGAAPNYTLGESAWVFSPTSANSTVGTNSEVGLMGDGNTATASYLNTSNGAVTTPYYYNTVSAVGANGEVAGTAKEYSGKSYTLSSNAAPTAMSSGFDAWVQPAGASSATRIGGSTFTSSSISTYSTSSVTATNNSVSYGPITIPAPSITPASGSFAANSFAYGYIPTSSSIPLGSTYATQVARNSVVTAINGNGLVGMYSSYYINNAQSASGQDAFVYNTSNGKYIQVGLTTDSYAANASSTGGVDSFVSVSGNRSSAIQYINASGQTAGKSALYIPGYTAASFSNAAWTATASGAVTQIGLYGTADGYHVNTFSGSNSQYTYLQYSDTVSAMNDKGMVAGSSARYNENTGSANGQDAWVYDPNNISSLTGTNMWIVDPAAEATSPTTGATESTTIDYLSPSGVAVGDYNFGNINTAFIWSESGGFDLLSGASIPAGLSASGYQNLINAYYTDTGGNTILATASFTNSNTVNGLVALTGAVPEPSSLSLLAVGATSLLRRRRRVTT